jgi:hypothetical protein
VWGPSEKAPGVVPSPTCRSGRRRKTWRRWPAWRDRGAQHLHDLMEVHGAGLTTLTAPDRGAAPEDRAAAAACRRSGPRTSRAGASTASNGSKYWGHPSTGGAPSYCPPGDPTGAPPRSPCGGGGPGGKRAGGVNGEAPCGGKVGGSSCNRPGHLFLRGRPRRREGGRVWRLRGGFWAVWFCS